MPNPTSLPHKELPLIFMSSSLAERLFTNKMRGHLKIISKWSCKFVATHYLTITWYYFSGLNNIEVNLALQLTCICVSGFRNFFLLGPGQRCDRDFARTQKTDWQWNNSLIVTWISSHHKLIHCYVYYTSVTNVIIFPLCKIIVHHVYSSRETTLLVVVTNPLKCHNTFATIWL